jgi:hypothetical protein
MMKNKWGNYSLKDGKVQKSYVREYSSKSPRLQLKEEKLVYKPTQPRPGEISPKILEDAWVINLRNTDESIREEDVGEAHQQGRQGIQESDQGRCETEEGSPKVKTSKRKRKREET